MGESQLTIEFHQICFASGYLLGKPRISLGISKAIATTRKGVWPCAAVAVGRVEATNLFNVTVRTPFTVKVVKSEEHWDAELVGID